MKLQINICVTDNINTVFCNFIIVINRIFQWDHPYNFIVFYWHTLVECLNSCLINRLIRKSVPLAHSLFSFQLILHLLKNYYFNKRILHINIFFHVQHKLVLLVSLKNLQEKEETVPNMWWTLVKMMPFPSGSQFKFSFFLFFWLKSVSY